jgi:hypothetical protein
MGLAIGAKMLVRPFLVEQSNLGVSAYVVLKNYCWPIGVTSLDNTVSHIYSMYDTVLALEQRQGLFLKIV